MLAARADVLMGGFIVHNNEEHSGTVRASLVTSRFADINEPLLITSQLVSRSGLHFFDRKKATITNIWHSVKGVCWWLKVYFSVNYAILIMCHFLGYHVMLLQHADKRCSHVIMLVM
ncbi:hypothetical protein ABZP36_007579 [Zizania latifolia]